MIIKKIICHNRDDRSFHYKNRKFPVCARCTGIYLSSIIFLVIIIFDKSIIKTNIIMFILGLLLTLPLILDGVTQYMKYRESNNILRFITGILFSVGIIIMTKISVTLIRQLFIYNIF
jgi:uncharacterized membrane protein